MLTTNQMLEYLGLSHYEFQMDLNGGLYKGKYEDGFWVYAGQKFREVEFLPSFEKEALRKELMERCLEKVIHENLLKQRMDKVLEDGILEDEEIS